MTSYSLTEQLAKHLHRPVDEGTRDRARLHLLDWLACVAGARNSDFMQKVRGTGMADMSAHFASMAGNVLEMDDIHRTSILHPGPVVWSSLLVGVPNDMDDVLNAAVRGYEAMVAVGSTFDAHHYAHYHNTSTAGQFGAAAAVADLCGCDEGQLVSALGLAGSVAGGLWQMRHETNDAKQWHIERAMVNGGSAGLYAAHGITGPRFILEGPQGLYAATCKKPKPMTFPDQWQIWDVSFKPWAACRHAHPAIDAALELKARLGKLAGPITIETYADAISFCDRPSPETVHQAKFSLQHAVAVVTERGEPTLPDFEMDAVKALKKARARVSISELKSITKRYPNHYGARVTCAGEAVELIDTRGDPERPLFAEGVIAKAHALMTWGGLSKKQAGKAVLQALEGDDPVKIAHMVRKWLV